MKYLTCSGRLPSVGHAAILIFALLCGCWPTQTDEPPPFTPRERVANHSDNERLVSLLAWNVESGGSDPSVIAEQLAELSGYDVYCLCEVSPGHLDRYADALSSDFASISSKTGRSDRLQILFNNNRFELLDQRELHRHGDLELNNGTHRSPLFVRLRDRATKIEFIVMTNHLARRNAELRRQQAIGLREWARDQTVAVINIGDFNMDYDFPTRKGNHAFLEMLRDNIWHWVKPTEFIDTNWADSDGDGVDNYPNSMLDFAFVAGPAMDWDPVCRVIVRNGDFPDDESTSDHRPIEVVATLSK